MLANQDVYIKNMIRIHAASKTDDCKFGKDENNEFVVKKLKDSFFFSWFVQNKPISASGLRCEIFNKRAW